MQAHHKCLAPNCKSSGSDTSSYCAFHRQESKGTPVEVTIVTTLPNSDKTRAGDRSLAQLYPKYYKTIPDGWTVIDVYGVCKLFPVVDDTGCIHHAVKKLLVPGVRTGGKSFYNDIREARDTLNRWMQLNPE